MDTVKEVTRAVKGSLTITKIVGGLVVLVIILVVADAAGVTGWILQPVTTFKAWNDARKAKAK